MNKKESKMVDFFDQDTDQANRLDLQLSCIWNTSAPYLMILL